MHSHSENGATLVSSPKMAHDKVLSALKETKSSVSHVKSWVLLSLSMLSMWILCCRKDSSLDAHCIRSKTNHKQRSCQTMGGQLMLGCKAKNQSTFEMLDSLYTPKNKQTNCIQFPKNHLKMPIIHPKNAHKSSKKMDSQCLPETKSGSTPMYSRLQGSCGPFFGGVRRLGNQHAIASPLVVLVRKGFTTARRSHGWSKGCGSRFEHVLTINLNLKR